MRGRVEARLWKEDYGLLMVEPFKGMGTIRTNADLHVEDERQRRIGRDVHKDGAVLLFLGGNGEIAVLAELHAGETCTEDTGHDQRRLRETLA